MKVKDKPNIKGYSCDLKPCHSYFKIHAVAWHITLLLSQETGFMKVEKNSTKNNSILISK